MFDEDAVRQAMIQLGQNASQLPLVARLKRLEEQIREDPELSRVWAELEAAESSGGGCSSGGCGSGGCSTSASSEGKKPRNGGPKPGTKMELYAQFSDSSVLQEYVQTRHRFYVEVDRWVEAFFENLYGYSWQGVPEVDPLKRGAELSLPPQLGGIPLVDILPDEEPEVLPGD